MTPTEEEDGPGVMTQAAPDPAPLRELVASLAYRPGWLFHLEDVDRGQGSRGLTLDIVTLATNSYRAVTCETCRSAVTDYRVHHYMPVPPAAYDRRSWRRWLFEQVALVERHECCEFFQVDGERPFAPHHQPGADPYTIYELGTATEQRTSFRGSLNQ